MKKISWVFIGILFCILIVTSSLTSTLPLIGDEPWHAGQINEFVKGNYVILEKLSVPPIYHLIIASVSKLFHVDTLQGYRLLSTLFLWVFLSFIWYFAVNFNKKKTLQLLFFPSIFIFYFLVYTDIFSMFMVLGAYYFMQKKQYIPSTIFSMIAMLVRQNNVLWIGFIILIMFFNKVSWKKYLYYVPSFIVWGLYILMFGLVPGDSQHHQFGFYLTNIWFSLFIMFFMFMPYFVSRYPDMARNFKIRHGILVIILIILILFTFSPTHIYNQNYQIWFNLLLHHIYTNIYLAGFFIFIILITVLILLRTKFKEKWMYLIYPISILYLGISEMAEVRYYTIPFMLFLLCYKQDKKVELYTLIYYIFLSIGMLIVLLVNK